MNSMMKLAQALSTEQHDTELADKLDELSVEELSAILQELDEPVEKVASVQERSLNLIQVADTWGRELAKTAGLGDFAAEGALMGAGAATLAGGNHLYKKFKKQKVAGLGQKLVGGAMKAAITTPTATRMAVGGAAGAAAGLASSHGAQPGVNGQPGTGGNRLMSAAVGAAGGAALGAGAARGAKALGSMNNTVGRFAGGAMTAAAKAAPAPLKSTQMALNASHDMAKARGTAQRATYRPSLGRSRKASSSRS